MKNFWSYRAHKEMLTPTTPFLIKIKRRAEKHFFLFSNLHDCIFLRTIIK